MMRQFCRLKISANLIQTRRTSSFVQLLLFIISRKYILLAYRIIFQIFKKEREHTSLFAQNLEIPAIVLSRLRSYFLLFTANSQASFSFIERRSEADKKPIEKQTID